MLDRVPKALPKVVVPDDRSWYVAAAVGGRMCRFLIDTGCTHSCLPQVVFQQLDAESQARFVPMEKPSRVTGFIGEGAPILGTAWLNVAVPGKVMQVRFIVIDGPADCTLGIDFMEAYSVYLDYEHQMIWCREAKVWTKFPNARLECVTRREVEVPPKSEIAVAVRVMKADAGASLLLEQEESATGCGVAVARTVVETQQDGTAYIRVMNPHDKSRWIPEGVALATGEAAAQVATPIPMLWDPEQDAAMQRLLEQEARVRRAENQDDSSDSDDGEPTPPPAELKAEMKGEVPLHVTKLFIDSARFLNEDQKKRLARMLTRFQDTFVRSSIELGLSTVGEHVIDTGTAAPVRDQPRRIPLHKRDAVEQKIKEMLEVGVIRPSNSPWAACPVLVTKPDGSVRWCVDWRKLNEVTVKDSYPMPRVDECLERMEGAQWFSSLDLQHGYWQIPMREEDWQKTAFTTHVGLYEFTRTPMGVSNAPATFQRIMESVLNGLDLSIAVIYIDDIVVPGKTFEEAATNLETVLDRLQRANLRVKTKKCHLFQKSIQFLGHIVGADGIRPAQAKVVEISRWPAPCNIGQVRAFLGLAGYYRRMIPNFAHIADPLTRMLKKDAKFEWTLPCEQAFQTLKARLMEEPVMAYPKPVGDYVLDTDASNVAAGAVLSQVQDGVERVIAYWSKAWSPSQRKYSTVRREMLAALLAMEAFSFYLCGAPEFTLRTDHACLRWLRNMKTTEALVNRWLTRFEQFHFKVVHRAGAKHANADALSRMPCLECGQDLNLCRGDGDEVVCTNATCPDERPPSGPPSAEVQVRRGRAGQGTRKRAKKKKKPVVESVAPLPDGLSEAWDFDLIKEHQRQDTTLAQVIQWKQENEVRPLWDEISIKSPDAKYWWSRWDSLRLDPDSEVLQFFWFDQDGTERWRTLLPESLQKPILREWHDGVEGGHLGTNKTWSRAKRSCFLWRNMRSSVRQHIRECLVCARNKPGGHGRNAPVRQFPAGGKHEMIGMDLVGPLPATANKNKYLLVIIDYWTRWAEAVPIPNKESATVARAFVDTWVCRYGTPRVILTDQGKEFDSYLFKDCCRIMGSWKKRTTPFHARCNGLTERLNQTIERMLSAFVQENQKDWDSQVHTVMMAYRTAVQESTGVTPYAMMFGEECPVPLDWVFGAPKQVPEEKIQFVRDLKRQINAAFEVARRSMLSAIKRQKRSYDRGAKNVAFEVGQFVMCHDKTKKVGRNPALRAKWRGPYIIVAKHNDASVVIQESQRGVAKACHVDRLKHCFPPSAEGWRWAFKMLKRKYPTMEFDFPDQGELSDGEGADADPQAQGREAEGQAEPQRQGEGSEHEQDAAPGQSDSQGEEQVSVGESSGMSSILNPGPDSDEEGPRQVRRPRRKRTRRERDKTAAKGAPQSGADTVGHDDHSTDEETDLKQVAEKPQTGVGAGAPTTTRGGRKSRPPQRYGVA